MQDEKQPAVYITANRYRGTIYVGVTSALWNRIHNHKNKVFDGFTAEHDVTKLVWYEHYHSMEHAIRREKQLKAWKRDWKIRIIEAMNPDWRDLHEEIDPLATLVEYKELPPKSTTSSLRRQGTSWPQILRLKLKLDPCLRRGDGRRKWLLLLGST